MNSDQIAYKSRANGDLSFYKQKKCCSHYFWYTLSNNTVLSFSTTIEERILGISPCCCSVNYDRSRVSIDALRFFVPI